ncbi:porin [Candidatus Pelagibacter sp.]|nr:porin [Candidatus Pelagibacter sp.]
MNNFKKIGLTALAGSLVATSVYAGEMSVAGSASWRISNHAGTEGGKTMAMGNQLTFTGSGEMDNGMNVALSFILDQGDDHPATAATAANAEARADTSPFDSHSITVSSDAMGAITFAGEGASSAQNTIDTTAAGDIWDNTFASYTKPGNASAGTKTLLWALPSMVDGLGVTTSYTGSSTGAEATIGYALTYTGVEGLSVSYGAGEVAGNTAGTTGADVTTMKASFAFGPVTAAMSINDYDITGASNEEQSSYKISYTVSDELSVSYGSETHETTGQSTDEEFDQISVSYTTGGLTASVSQTSAENVTGATNTDQQKMERRSFICILI